MHQIDKMLQLQLEGEQEEARKISDELEALGIDGIPTNPGQPKEDIWQRHSFNRGWFLIQDGDYQKGCQLLENGRFINVYGSPPLQTNAPIFNPQQHTIKDKSILISLEGGYGDEIIHARFATSFKKQGAKAVYIACAPELVSTFSRIEGVDKVILRNQAHIVQHDYWVPGFSAGWVAGHTFEDFPSDPYLTPRQDSVELWKSFINSDKIKVGIRWAGNPKFEHQQFRRFPENFITNLSKYEEVQLYSFQRDHNLIQLPEGVVDLQHFLLSWEDTLAAIANVDIMITSCTSIAHLSAAMGKETWVIVPVLPYHTWTPGAPESNTSPYYKCVKLFRQTKKGMWNDTFQNLYAAFEERFKLNHIDQPDEDKTMKRINLGCGHTKYEGYHNVDKSDIVSPDEKVDLDTLPWPWKDSEYSHIVAKDIIEHLGESSEDFIDIVKEMYRISDNGALWEISTPHWRCDTALDDPTHKRVITLGMLHMFNRRLILDKLRKGGSESLIAFDDDIDIEVVDVQFDYTAPYAERIRTHQIDDQELNFALNHFNNVALSTKMLIQVHKPPRYDNNDLSIALKKE